MTYYIGCDSGGLGLNEVQSCHIDSNICLISDPTCLLRDVKKYLMKFGHASAILL